jgi:hypothetical protein
MLAEQIKNDIKSAMKAGETNKRDILRLVVSKADLIAKEDLKRHVEDRVKASDADMLLALQRQLKQSKEVIDIYKQENKNCDKEKEEVSILTTYLPAQKSEDEIRDLVSSIILSIEGNDINKLKGLVMKELSQYKNEMDMKLAGSIVVEMVGK